MGGELLGSILLFGAVAAIAFCLGYLWRQIQEAEDAIDRFPEGDWPHVPNAFHEHSRTGTEA